MNYYINTKNQVFAFDLDTQAKFITSDFLEIPLTFMPDDFKYLTRVRSTITLDSVKQLSDAKVSRNSSLALAYQNAITQNVAFTNSSGVDKDYQSDSNSIENLSRSILGCQSSQSTPTGFYWVSSDNTQVPFSFNDLQLLTSAIFLQASVAFAKYQSLKSSVNEATTLDAVQSIAW